jgi:hypothetical protein
MIESPGMNLWTQLFLLPMTTFVYGLDFMVRILQAVQQTTQQIIVANPNLGSPPLVVGGLGRAIPIGGVLRGDAITTLKETREMSDCCSSDRCGEKFCEVRVYEYYILSVKPCDERLIYGPTSIVVTTNMSGEAFSTYAIAMFCQDHRVPREDAQYLRVCYRINCTFPKEREDCSSHAKDQARALSDIRDILRERWGSTAGTHETTGTSGTASTSGPTGKHRVGTASTSEAAP